VDRRRTRHLGGRLARGLRHPHRPALAARRRRYRPHSARPTLAQATISRLSRLLLLPAPKSAAEFHRQLRELGGEPERQLQHFRSVAPQSYPSLYKQALEAQHLLQQAACPPAWPRRLPLRWSRSGAWAGCRGLAWWRCSWGSRASRRWRW
jgi:hypothetical protein